MVKVYLCSEDMSYSLLLPVTPREIKVVSALGVRKYETANAGNISSAGFRELTAISFSSFFPSSRREYSLREDSSLGDAAFGIGYIPLIKRFIDNRLPCRLIIVGKGIDQTMILDTFEYSMSQGKDVYYSMSFTEKRQV